MRRRASSNHNSPRGRRGNSARLLQLAVAALSLQAAQNALATARIWSGADGLFWNNTAAWSAGVVPVNGDDVTMGTQFSSSSIQANFTSTYSGVGLNSLKINASGFSSGGFTVDQFITTSAMIASLEIIGDTVGNNFYVQNGGSNSATSGLILGNSSGGFGNYTITGVSNATLTTPNLIVGNQGAGNFSQSGGTVTITNGLTISESNTSASIYNLSGGTLTLGSASTFSIGTSVGSVIQSGGTVNFLGATGFSVLNGTLGGNTNSYSLSGTGQITNAGFESIGVAGAGAPATFTQSAGTTNTLAGGGILTVGNTGNGAYNLNGGTLTGTNTIIGKTASGTFTQGGGTWNISNIDIGLQAGSTGAYTLSAGTVQLAGNMVVGEGGAGIVTQSGGTITTTGLNSKIIVGSGSTGTYTLSGTGQINANELDVGFQGAGAFTDTFNQSAGTVTLTGQLFVAENIDATGNYNLSGPGILSAESEALAFSAGSVANFVQSGGSNSALSLDVGVNNGSTAAYTLNSGNLTLGTINNPGALTVSVITTGSTFTQNGGNVSILGSGGSLIVADNTGSTGTYLLKAGNLSADSQIIGDLGTGTFTQNGGTNTVTGTGTFGGLFVGYRGAGTYTLAGLGVQANLNATTESIGNSFAGTFTQGFNTTNSVSIAVIVGANAGGTGTFNISGGNLISPNLQLGVAAPGTFTQTGGTVTIFTNLIVGAGSTGAYNFFTGNLTTSNTNTGFVVSPTGTFSQSGGNFTGYLLNQGSVVYSGGNFAGTLENAPIGNVTLNASLTAGGGVLNRGFINVPLNITLASGISGLNLLDNEGTLQLSAGSLVGVPQILNNNFITGFGTIGGSGGLLNNGVITAAGTLILSNSGTNSNTGTMIDGAGSALQIDVPLANTGSINLTGGTLRGAGTLNNSLGGTIAGFGTLSIATFNNSGGTLFAQGGTLHLTNPLANPGIIEVAPGATLAGATISSTNSIQGAGTISNIITNSGTIEPIAGTLVLTAPLTNTAAGTLTTAFGNKLLLAGGLAANPGLINLAGGTFDNGSNPLNNTGSILGFGTFRSGSTGLTNNGSILFAGGSSNISGPVTNTATHTLEVRNSPAIFTGPVTNNLNATFKTTSTTATFAASFTNNGNYVSDPSTNVFQSTTTNSGNMTGSTGDVYIFQTSTLNNSGNFTNGGTLSSSDNIINSNLFTQTGPQNWSPNTTFTNTAGTATFSTDTGSPTSSPLSILLTAGTVNFSSDQHLNSLSIQSGNVSFLSGLSKTNALSFAGSTSNWTGTLDLTGSKLIVEDTSLTRSADLAHLKNQAVTSNIQSSTATAFNTAAGRIAKVVAVSDNAVRMATFPAGSTNFGATNNVDSNSILIEATYKGDANLDGTIDIQDLTDVANHWQQPVTDWSQGDFDNSNFVDINDLTAVAINWQAGANSGGGSSESFTEALTQIGGLHTPNPAPEPASLTLLTLGGILFTRRRK